MTEEKLELAAEATVAAIQEISSASGLDKMGQALVESAVTDMLGALDTASTLAVVTGQNDRLVVETIRRMFNRIVDDGFATVPPPEAS